MILLASKKTNKLTDKEIIQICNLKDTHWRFGLKSQVKWFKNNIKKNDIHNILKYKKKIIGYTLLRVRYFKIKLLKKFLLFDTLIISKKYRDIKLSIQLMKFNNRIIRKNKKVSCLMCSKKMINFYKKFGWKIINKKKLKFFDHKFNSNFMVFNLKNLNFKKIEIHAQKYR
jgi:hypothetical protein